MIDTESELAAALLDGGDIWCDSSVTIPLTTTMHGTKPCRIHDGRFTRDTGPAFEITTSDVEFDRVRITGGGQAAGYDQTQKLIYARGTAATPLAGIRVHDSVFTGSRADNVWLEWCTDTAVRHNTISSYLYSGVMVISGERTDISHNTIVDAPLTDGVVNTYGIAVTDIDNTVAARSRNITITGNHVSLVDWEGIDTHGGDRLTITGNHVTACPRGIALVTGNTTRVTAPTNCLVTGNTIDAMGARRPDLIGVALSGIAGTSASATVTGNQIRGYSSPYWANYWSRGDTFIGGNNTPFLPWTPITLAADYSANTTYRPEYMVDGNTVWLRGGVIPKSGGVSARTDIGVLTNPAAWPTELTFVALSKGSNAAAGTGMIAVYPDGMVRMLYGQGTDSYTYFFSGSYQAA